MSELMETTNLILIIGFIVVCFFLWILTNICIRIVDRLDLISNINDSLYEVNQRLRRKGLYKDSDEQNHSQFME
jgi:uncharacterized protein YqhQ